VFLVGLSQFYPQNFPPNTAILTLSKLRHNKARRLQTPKFKFQLRLSTYFPRFPSHSPLLISLLSSHPTALSTLPSVYTEHTDGRNFPVNVKSCNIFSQLLEIECLSLLPFFLLLFFSFLSFSFSSSSFSSIVSTDSLEDFDFSCLQKTLLCYRSAMFLTHPSHAVLPTIIPRSK
jgi:hypothetical protein